MTYAIIGTGAIGGFYGGMLAHAGHDVHFLFHSDYNEAKERGLIVKSIYGDFTINPVNAYKSSKDMPACDVIIVGMKTVKEQMLPELIKPVLKPTSLVVLIQNGLNIEKHIAEQLPESVSVAGGMAFICSNKIGPATINHLDYGFLNVGLYRGSEQMLHQFCDDMNASGVKTTYAPDLKEARWKKLVWNIPYNGMTVILDTTTECLMKNQASRALIYDIMLEVLKAADANGVHIPQSFADDMMDLTDNMRPYKPSMRLDFDNHRPMEIHYIYSETINAAHESGIKIPKIEVMEQQLKFIQSTYL